MNNTYSLTISDGYVIDGIPFYYTNGTEVYIDGTEYAQNAEFDENKFLSEHISWEENVDGETKVHNLYALDERNEQRGIQYDEKGKVKQIWFRQIS